MAKPLSVSFLSFFLFSFVTLTLTLIPVTGKEPDSFGILHDRSFLGIKKEKLTKFRVYWHDIVGGQNPSSVQIIKPLNSSIPFFGMARMIDNPLTLGPKLSSKIVGRAQGLYTATSKEELSLLMAMNFAFTSGKYNGSTITVLGRNPVFEKVREMPVVGGSGLFRFARGYVLARTYELDMKIGNAIVEYNCYVLHY